MTPVLNPIALDDHALSVLDWFDQVDDQHRVVLVLDSDSPLPAAASARAKWFQAAFEHVRNLEFVLTPFTATGHQRRIEVTQVQGPTARPPWPTPQVTVRLPLTDLWGLPGDDPAQELAQLRGFLTWVKDKTNSAPGPHLPYLQWFRGGSTSRGLEWAGVEEPVRQAWTHELQAWHDEPWFQAWHTATLAHWRHRWPGIHSWASFQLHSEVEVHQRFAQALGPSAAPARRTARP